MMFTSFAYVFRAILDFVRRHFRRQDPPQVYVCRAIEANHGKVQLLFRRPIDRRICISLLEILRDVPPDGGAQVRIGSRTISVEWRMTRRDWFVTRYVAGDIELTAFEYVLGTFEPRCEVMDGYPSDLKQTVIMLSREQDINWASELGYRHA